MQYINAFGSVGGKNHSSKDIIKHCTSTDVNSDKFFTNQNFMTSVFKDARIRLFRNSNVSEYCSIVITQHKCKDCHTYNFQKVHSVKCSTDLNP